MNQLFLASKLASKYKLRIAQSFIDGKRLSTFEITPVYVFYFRVLSMTMKDCAKVLCFYRVLYPVVTLMSFTL